VDAALGELAVWATAVMVASALVRFFDAWCPDFLHSSGSSGPGLICFTSSNSGAGCSTVTV
jgi:hypothetical protein